MKILQRIQFPDIWNNLGVDVDLPNGLLIGAAMMKTTTLIATGMVVLVVTMTLVGGTLTAQTANALIPIMVLQPRKPLLQPLPEPPQPLNHQVQLQSHHRLTDVDSLAGPLILCVTMKTTTLIATGMVVLVVTMTLVGGTLSAM
jgi:hypothetical protein